MPIVINTAIKMYTYIYFNAIFFHSNPLECTKIEIRTKYYHKHFIRNKSYILLYKYYLTRLFTLLLLYNILYDFQTHRVVTIMSQLLHLIYQTYRDLLNVYAKKKCLKWFVCLLTVIGFGNNSNYFNSYYNVLSE